jgi:hypothetical protein
MRRGLFNLAAAASLLICVAGIIACAWSSRRKLTFEFERRGQRWEMALDRGEVRLSNDPQLAIDKLRFFRADDNAQRAEKAFGELLVSENRPDAHDIATAARHREVFAAYLSAQQQSARPPHRRPTGSDRTTVRPRWSHLRSRRLFPCGGSCCARPSFDGSENSGEGDDASAAATTSAPPRGRRRRAEPSSTAARNAGRSPRPPRSGRSPRKRRNEGCCGRVGSCALAFPNRAAEFTHPPGGFPHPRARFPNSARGFPRARGGLPNSARGFPNPRRGFPNSARRLSHPRAGFPNSAAQFPNRVRRWVDRAARFPSRREKFRNLRGFAPLPIKWVPTAADGVECPFSLTRGGSSVAKADAKPKAVRRAVILGRPPEPGQEEVKAAVVKPKRERKPTRKDDPKTVAAAREIRDRYLEQFNAGLVLPAGKYHVAVALPEMRQAVKALPVAA